MIHERHGPNYYCERTIFITDGTDILKYQLVFYSQFNVQQNVHLDATKVIYMLSTDICTPKGW